ncbi:MAG: hypothetical protein K8S25_16505 [Alphaproteobacteria bacterium]|nr:hypothetical protein [Alphaproteobacteria bacterium]
MKLRTVLLASALSLTALGMGIATVAVQAAPQMEVLDLGDGFQFELLGAGDTPAKVANPKSIYLNVALKDAKLVADKAKLIEAADRMFESVLMGAAEKGYYKRATVNVRRAGTPETFEDFVYLRGANEVWLRQAGKETWKVAQDAKWTPPAVEKVDVQGFGSFHVEQAIEIPAPEGFRRAAEVDFVTATPVVDIQRKYQEIKALWARIDREKMRTDGFDMILLGNFAESQRGRFHARRGFFVRIPRDTDGAWPELPDRAPDNRDLMISKNEVTTEELTKTIGNTFASGLNTMRLTQIIAPVVDPMAAGPTAKIGFGEALPVIKFDPSAFVIKIQ